MPDGIEVGTPPPSPSPQSRVKTPSDDPQTPAASPSPSPQSRVKTLFHLLHHQGSKLIAVPSKSGQNTHSEFVFPAKSQIAVPSKSGQNLSLCSPRSLSPSSPSPQSRVKTLLPPLQYKLVTTSPSPQSRVKTQTGLLPRLRHPPFAVPSKSGQNPVLRVCPFQA